MEINGSWLERLAAGDVEAADELWRHFFARLSAYARKRLNNLPGGLGDPEDIAASVFRSICRMADSRAFPSVTDPEHLWPLLSTIAARKIGKLVRRARPGRDGQQIRETDLGRLGVTVEEAPALDQVMGREPSQELMVALGDLWSELLARLESRSPSNSNVRKIAELWLEGQTGPMIVAATSTPPRTVARRLALIRRLLQELAGEDPPAKDENS